MKARWRVWVASSVVLLTAGAPALAQEATTPAQNDVIGNPQLRDFSINGTVTQPAPSPVEQRSAPAPTSTPTAQQPSQTETRPPRAARESAADTARDESPARPRPSSSEPASATVELPPPTERRIATPSLTDEAPTLTSQPALVPAAAASDLDTPGRGLSVLPWLIAGLAFAAAAAWYFLRQRPRESYAGAGNAARFDAPSPVLPTPVRTPPVRTPPPPAPPKPAATGVVSTRLRPWLEIEFTPQRAIVDEQKAAVAFELSVINSGTVPARDVLLEASLFNAGPMQDQQIRLFFDNPVAKGDRIPLIPPLQRVSVSTAVFLSRDQVRPIEVEGRQLFVPMIAFNALYGWGGRQGQSSASYLVGKMTKTGEKLAPFRVDLGPRVFRNLAAREHELRLRK